MKQSFMPSGLFNSWPLQFLRTGLYYRSYGYLLARTAYGFWWSGTAGAATRGHYLDTYTGYIYAQSNNFRGLGFALRCDTDNVAPKANQLANFPLNFLRTGFYSYSDGKVYNRTTDGYWWSATRSSSTNANRLGTGTTSVNPQYSYTRGYGFAVRCGV